MDEQRQIELTQRLLERKRALLELKEGMGALADAPIPLDRRTPSEWERRKERLRREVLQREKDRWKR